MKILFVAESFPISKKIELTGGVESGDFFISQELSERNQVSVITAAKKNARSVQELDKIQVYRVGLPSTYQSREGILYRLSFLVAAVKKAKQLDFEVVHGSNVFSQLVAAIIGLVYRKPTVAKIADVYLGSWFGNTKWSTAIIGEIMERLILSYSWNHIIAWSKYTAKKIRKYNRKTKLTVIGGGISLQYYQTIKAKKNQTRTLICISRLVQYKRVDEVIRIYHQVQKHVPCELQIIGMGDQLEALQELSTQLNLKSKVQFLGFLPEYGQVIQHLKQAHVLIHASRVEGFGLVTLDAMACGVPYVHSDLSVTSELTQHGQGGYLYKPGDIQAAAEQVTQLLTNSRIYNQKAKEGLRLAQTYAWSQVASDTEAVFRSTVEKD